MIAQPANRAFAPTHRTHFEAHHLLLEREGVGDQIPAIFFMPKAEAEKRPVTLIVHPEGKANLIDAETGEPVPLITALVEAGHNVLIIDVFLTGEYGDAQRDESDRLFTTYNRTTAALRVQDILTALRCFTGRDDVPAVNLIGIGQAGLWSLLAAGFADVNRVVVDANQFDSNNDEAYLQSLPIPIIRRAGDFRTAGTLVAPRPLLIHNTGDAFQTDWIADVYRAVGATDRLKVETGKLSQVEIAAWLIKSK